MLTMHVSERTFRGKVLLRLLAMWGYLTRLYDSTQPTQNTVHMLCKRRTRNMIKKPYRIRSRVGDL